MIAAPAIEKLHRKSGFSSYHHIYNLKNKCFTFQFVVFRVGRKQDVREEFLKAVASIPWPVLHIGPHRLVELHQKLLGRCPQLLNHLVPLVNVLRLQH